MFAGGFVKVGVVACLWLSVTSAFAKKDKPILPAYILQAHTVAVVIDPQAGISLQDPYANQTAQKDVEAAIAKWGRFNTVLSTTQADLVIVVRKGHDQPVEETLPNPRQNGRAGSLAPPDGGVGIGAQRGTQQPSSADNSSMNDPTGARTTHPQLEVGGQDDFFEVYAGNVERPLDGPAGWKWIRKNGLHTHDVPAVDEFRKAIAEAEKQASKAANGSNGSANGSGTTGNGNASGSHP
jgi:hypothetical protein